MNNNDQLKEVFPANDIKYFVQARLSEMSYISEDIPCFVDDYYKNIAVFLTENEAQLFIQNKCYPHDRFRIICGC